MHSLPRLSWIFPRVAGSLILIALGHATVSTGSDQIFIIMINSLLVTKTPRKSFHTVIPQCSCSTFCCSDFRITTQTPLKTIPLCNENWLSSSGSIDLFLVCNVRHKSRSSSSLLVSRSISFGVLIYITYILKCEKLS
jgi:hypothetical protein